MTWTRKLLADLDRLERRQRQELMRREVLNLKAKLVRAQAENEAMLRRFEARIAQVKRALARQPERPN